MTRIFPVALALMFIFEQAGQSQTEVKITAENDATAHDLFGISVAISGDYAVIGASRDGGVGDRSSSAYVFRRAGFSWPREDRLTAADSAGGFGKSVAISGDFVVVGALTHDEKGQNAGAAYIFRRNNLRWNQQAKLTANDAAAEDRFGRSVAISGDYALIGAFPNVDLKTDSGSAYIFKRAGTNWNQMAKLIASDADTSDGFGNAVALSGDIALVGADRKDDVVAGRSAGAAYIFIRRDTSWVQEVKLTAGDAAAGDKFGSSVSVTQDYAVVGALFNDANGKSNSGAAYIFKRTGTSWNQEAKLIAGDATAQDKFGVSVALNGAYAMVGAITSDHAKLEAGSTYIFKRNGTSWDEKPKLIARDAAAEDQFGNSIALSGEYAVIGAFHDDNDDNQAMENSGSAYLYTSIFNQPPKIDSVSAPSQIEEALDITIDATVKDDRGLASVFLNYRQGGETAFEPTLMSLSGSLFRGVIPGGAVASRGVEYFIKAMDSDGDMTRHPPSGIHSVQVIISEPGIVKESPQPNGIQSGDYRLISVPLLLKNPGPKDVLEDDLGPYLGSDGKHEWRFFALREDQNNVELTDPAFSFAMAPGKAFWLAVREKDKVIDTGQGETIPSDEPFVISLHPKWNFVATPFNFPILVKNVSLKSGRTFKIRKFTGPDWNDPMSSDTVKAVQPFLGYAVHNDSSGIDLLFINPDHTASSGVAFKNQSEGDITWSIHILAQCRNAHYRDNYAIASPRANPGKDTIDQPEPPVIGDYVSVYSPYPQQGQRSGAFCIDARPAPVAGEIWEFEVKTNMRDKVRLTFEKLETVPAGFEIWLVDEALQISQNLRENNLYSLVVHDENHPKRLKLIVGTREFISKAPAALNAAPASYELSQNFPNPFNPLTTIRYGLPRDENMTLKVYNLLGEEIITLVTHEQKKAGYHIAIWDGRNEQGEPVTSGVYLYRLRAGGFSVVKKMIVTR